MAQIKSYTDAEHRDAKKAGFKRKKPKKPAASASLRTLENWVARYNQWVTDLKAKAKQYKQKEADKKKRDTLKNKIRSIR